MITKRGREATIKVGGIEATPEKRNLTIQAGKTYGNGM